MGEAYVGEIRIFPYPARTPKGWAECDGSVLQIAEYETLYSLIGTTYGGDGRSTFALPDLRGRVPIGQGTSPTTGSKYVLGQAAGAERVTLLSDQMPEHTHSLNAGTAAATDTDPDGKVLANGTAEIFVDVPDGTVMMSAQAVGMTGGHQPHDNCGPTLPLRPCIALFGVYPSRAN
ncbi:MAG: phage tail protein [Sphingomonas sp.]|nr:phage tail protein [Sphingomonas sp.]|tara:strand:+ start:98 stop:625 length:528 start_codon:yes stop_codon:yes gene_type:complete